MTDVTYENEEYGNDAHPDQIEEIPMRERVSNSNTLANNNIVDANIQGGKLDLGSGDRRMRFDGKKGLWLGAAEFSNAPFSVDMAGNVSGSSFSLASISGDLDDVSDGSNYGKVALTNISAGNILLQVNQDLDSQGITIQTSSSGARAELLPDSNTGLSVVDDGGNNVIEALVGGTDVGDVIVGDYGAGQGFKYDKSENTTIFKGEVGVSTLTGELSAKNTIGFYDASDNFRGHIYVDSDQFLISSYTSGGAGGDLQLATYPEQYIWFYIGDDLVGSFNQTMSGDTVVANNFDLENGTYLRVFNDSGAYNAGFHHDGSNGRFYTTQGNFDFNNNRLINVSDPSNSDDAATKNYVDNNSGVSDHDNLTGVSSADHHSKYTDTEAVSAVESESLLDMGSGDIELDQLESYSTDAVIDMDYSSTAIAINKELITTANAELGSSSNPWGVVYCDGIDSAGRGGSYTDYLNVGGSGTTTTGDIYKTGTSNFDIKHPFKDDEEERLRYTCMEGPEVALFYRGTAETKDGELMIEFPDHYAHMVAQDRSVNLTPHSNTNIWVDEITEEGVKVKSEDDTEFSYMVMGKRRDYEDYPVEYNRKEENNNS